MANVHYQKTGTTFILRLDRGEELVSTLKAFCNDQQITLGTVQGIGAVNNAVIGLFLTKTREYHTTMLSGDHEITSLLGNITTMGGEPYLHLHATLTDATFLAYGGHLTSAMVSGTCEIFITVLDGNVARRFDADVGLNVLE
jgi:predicted DNA-binding protein with PD1-like motif